MAVPIDVQLPAEAICELLELADVEMLFFDEIRADVAVMAAEKCRGCAISYPFRQRLPEKMKTEEKGFCHGKK